MTVSPVPSLNQTPCQDSFRPQPSHLQQQQKQQCGSHPRQFKVPGCRGNPLSDVWRSPGGTDSPWSEPRGSATPGLSVAGRGMPWSDARASSGGRGIPPWMNPRGRGARRLRGSLRPNQGREGRAHVSAAERPDLFFKKSMVEDPWKNLKPVILASKETIETGGTLMLNIEGNRSDAETLESQASLKKIKSSQITDNFSSCPSPAESLDL